MADQKDRSQHSSFGAILSFKRFLGMRMRSSQAMRLWGKLGGHVLFVPCMPDNPDDPVVGLGEYQAAVAMSLTLRALFPKVTVDLKTPLELGLDFDSKPEEFDKQFDGKSVVALGTPDINPVVREVLRRLSRNPKDEWFRSIYCSESNTASTDTDEKPFICYKGKRYYTEFLPNKPQNFKTISSDHGITIFRPSCFGSQNNVTRRLLLCMGTRTYGTGASALIMFHYKCASKIYQRVVQEAKKKGTTFRRIANDLSILVNVRPLETGQSLLDPSRLTTILEPDFLEGIKCPNPASVVSGWELPIEGNLWTWITCNRVWLLLSFCVMALAFFLRSIPVGIAGGLSAIVAMVIERHERIKEM